MVMPVLAALHVPTAAGLAQITSGIDVMHSLSTVGGAALRLRTTDSATRASTTTFADDSILTIASVPAGTYLVEAEPRWFASGTTADIKVAFTFPVGNLHGSTFWAQGTGATGGTGSPDLGVNTTLTSGQSLGSRGSFGAGLSGRITGVMVLTASGTVALAWAPAASTAETLLMAAGSWLRLTRTA